MPGQAVIQNNNDWRKGLLFSLAFHLTLFILAWVAGGLWKGHRPMPPVYTVRLFEPQMPKQTKQVARPKKAKSPPAKKEVSPKVKPKKTRPSSKKVQKQVQKAQKPSKKVVSLKPKKPTKPKKVVKKEPSPEALLQSRLKRLQEKVKEKEEEQLLKEKLGALAARLKEKKEKVAREEARPSGPGTGELSQDEALRAYCTAIYERVREHWSFPEQLFDKKGLTCVVVVRILADGTLQKTWFEQKSGHELFDRSAMRAVKESVPFPKIPKSLGPGPLEIGIRFMPGKVGG